VAEFVTKHDIKLCFRPALSNFIKKRVTQKMKIILIELSQGWSSGILVPGCKRESLEKRRPSFGQGGLSERSFKQSGHPQILEP